MNKFAKILYLLGAIVSLIIIYDCIHKFSVNIVSYLSNVNPSNSTGGYRAAEIFDLTFRCVLIFFNILSAIFSFIIYHKLNKNNEINIVYAVLIIVLSVLGLNPISIAAGVLSVVVNNKNKKITQKSGGKTEWIKQ